MKYVKTILWTFGVLILGFFIFIGVLTFMPEINSYRDRTEFDSKKWRSWEQTVGEPSLRWNMIHDLESKYNLKGMTKTKLTELLGMPDSEATKEIRYFLGMSGHGIDTGSLVFEIKNDKVLNYHVWHG